MLQLKRSLLVAASAVFAAAFSANGGVIFYDNGADFLAAISNPGVDTYNDLPTDLVSSPINRTAGVYDYQATAANNFYPAGSAADRWLSVNTATDFMLLNGFDPAVRGVGGFFFGTDINGNFLAGQSITINIIDASGSYSRTLDNTTTSTFLGMVSNSAIASVSVQSVQPPVGYNWASINDLTLGAAGVPEPGTFATGLLALGVLVAARRKRS